MDVTQDLKDARRALDRDLSNKESEAVITFRRDEVDFYTRLAGPTDVEIATPTEIEMADSGLAAAEQRQA